MIRLLCIKKLFRLSKFLLSQNTPTFVTACEAGGMSWRIAFTTLDHWMDHSNSHSYVYKKRAILTC